MENERRPLSKENAIERNHISDKSSSLYFKIPGYISEKGFFCSKAVVIWFSYLIPFANFNAIHALQVPVRSSLIFRNFFSRENVVHLALTKT